MSSSPLILPRLQAMEAEGSNVGVLSIMQERALTDAIRMRENKGFTAHPSADVIDLADGNLPRGEGLMQQYLLTRANGIREPLAVLQRAGHALSLAAGHLERSAARAQTKQLPVAEYAQVEHALGQRYASIMAGAKMLEGSGVVPVYQTGKLSALTARPEGPLANYFDKAVALMQNGAENKDRSQARERG